MDDIRRVRLSEWVLAAYFAYVTALSWIIGTRSEIRLRMIVVNGLLLWLTSWVAGKLSLPFHITGFWAAFWGAIIVGLVSWVLNLFIRDKRERDDEPPPVRVVRVR